MAAQLPRGCPRGAKGQAEEVYTQGMEGLGTSPGTLMNDPSAGSPTETLLRLLLPLNDQV